jgi:three-Cys-motif partner protein
MDLLLHFPTGPVKRNFLHDGFDRTIDATIGTGAWRSDVHSAEEVARLIDHLRRQLHGIGYDEERVNTLPVTNSRNTPLYHLVFASKDSRGMQIWKSITRHDGPQRGFGF